MSHVLFMPLRIERFGNKWDIFTWYVETCFRDTCAGLLQAESSQELRKELSPELKISSFASFGDGSLDFLNSRDFGLLQVARPCCVWAAGIGSLVSKLHLTTVVDRPGFLAQLTCLIADAEQLLKDRDISERKQVLREWLLHIREDPKSRLPLVESAGDLFTTAHDGLWRRERVFAQRGCLACSFSTVLAATRSQSKVWLVGGCLLLLMCFR